MDFNFIMWKKKKKDFQPTFYFFFLFLFLFFFILFISILGFRFPSFRPFLISFHKITSV